MSGHTVEVGFVPADGDTTAGLPPILEPKCQELLKNKTLTLTVVYCTCITHVDKTAVASSFEPLFIVIVWVHI